MQGSKNRFTQDQTKNKTLSKSYKESSAGLFYDQFYNNEKEIDQICSLVSKQISFDKKKATKDFYQTSFATKGSHIDGKEKQSMSV